MGRQQPMNGVPQSQGHGEDTHTTRGAPGLSQNTLYTDLVLSKITTIAIDGAKTPPDLFGIDRKIAYANKKCHSG
uniref:Uncharacterized protein n=1 Tax=Glossina morsitans morsitans TaxID=37546 RepID=A0A1B0FJT9_GLOMM